MTSTTTLFRVPSPDAFPVRRLAWGIALVALLAHSGLGAGGVWSFDPLNYDDPQVLTLASETSVGQILTEPTWYAYKPVYFLSMKVDTFFGDGTPAVAHLHNALLHALAAALLFLALRSLLRNTWVAGAAALLFAVHPVHAESVAWISGRKDVLSLVFVLLCHLCYRRARDRGRVSLAAPVLLALGGLTKGTVWVWAGVLLLDEIVEAGRRRAAGEALSLGAVAKRWLPCFVVALGGVVLDGWMAAMHGPGAVEHGVSTFALAAAMAGVHARYVFHLLVPVGFSIDYGVDPAGSWSSPLSWVGLVLLVLAVGLFVVSIRRRFAVGILASGLWLLGLLPMNNLWPCTATLMADRYLYLPAAGLYLLLLGGLARYRRGRTIVLAVVVVALGVLCMKRTSVFVDSASVWADAVDTVPGSALAWFQRGQAAGAQGEWDRAEEAARRAIELEPRPEILVKARLLRTAALLGRIGSREERGLPTGSEELEEVLDEARKTCRLAEALETMPVVKEDPREVQAEAAVLRGKALERWRDPVSALEAYEKAVRTWPRHATAHYNLATLLAGTGTAEDLALAEKHLLEALRHRPGFLDAEIQLSTVLALEGRMDEAIKGLEHARARHGRTPDLLFAEAQVHLAGRQDVKEAEEILHELKRIAPDHPKASRLLSDIQLAQGRVLFARGRTKRNRGDLRAALQRFEAAARARERCWKAEVGAGDALLQLGRYRDARERYRKAFEMSNALPWVQRLVARAGVLEAAWTARHAEDDVDRAEAARIAAGAIRIPVTSIDLGFLSFHEELDGLRRVAEALEARGAASEHEGRVLRAAVLAATGDEGRARSEIRGVLTALGPDTSQVHTLEAALLLRGLLRDRGADVEGARRDYRLLADRRPDEPLPALRLRQLALRAARARLSVAQGCPERPEGIREAAEEVERASEAIRVFADEHPDVLSAGLLATEAAMSHGRWIEALRRLNGLKERFPREATVYRGQSAIYVARYLATRERTLLTEALRSLRSALTLDPRNPRTSLDAAHVARIANRMDRALEHARRARTFELVPHGPAARALAELYVAGGRQELEAGRGQAALQAAQAAREADSGSAAPWILMGDVFLRVRKYDDALEAYRTAKELEPLSEKASRGLARVHRKRVIILQMRAAGFRTPRHPERADPEGWKALDEEGREKAVQAWTERAERFERARAESRRMEMREIEAALRLDPEAEEAEGLRARRKSLRKMDPQARREAYQEADLLFALGRDLYLDGRYVKALAKLQQATDLFSDHLPAHVYTALTLHALLNAPGGESEEEARLDAKYWLMVFEALHAADALDPLDRYPDRHRVRGQLNELRWVREGRTEARVAALRAYERFLRALDAAGRGDEDIVAWVRRRIARLETAEGD